MPTALAQPPSTLKLVSAPEVVSGPWVEPAPLYPPLDWFTDEAADQAPPKLTLYPGGRIAGVVAPADRCTLNEVFPGECWTMPRPDDGRGSTLMCPLDSGEFAEDYRMAHVGTTWCDDGAGGYVEIVSANLSGAGGHALHTGTPESRSVHYNAATDDTRYMVGRGRYVWSDVAGGLVFVGAAWPEIDERKAAEVRAAACSVDLHMIWGQGIDDYRLIGTCLVNIGALPSRYAAVVEHGDVALMIYEENVMSIVNPNRQPAPPDIAHAEGCSCSRHAAARQAMYVEVPRPASPAWGQKISWAGGVGMFSDRLAGADGSEQWIVFPVVGGEVADEPVVVLAADATALDAVYEWVDPYDDDFIDLVVTAGVAQASLGRRLTVGRPPVVDPTRAASAASEEALRLAKAVYDDRVAEGLAAVDGMVV